MSTCTAFLTRNRKTNTAVFTTPTFNHNGNPDKSWPADPFQPSNPSPTNIREDRPRLIAPAYKWAALPRLIAHTPYLASWNKTIFGNASDYYDLPLVPYIVDGGSGILDVSRQVKLRLKAFSYVYRMTNDTKWADRAWLELEVCAPLHCIIIHILLNLSSFAYRMPPELGRSHLVPVIIPSGIPRIFSILRK